MKIKTEDKARNGARTRRCRKRNLNPVAKMYLRMRIVILMEQKVINIKEQKQMRKRKIAISLLIP